MSLLRPYEMSLEPDVGAKSSLFYFLALSWEVNLEESFKILK